MTMRKFHISSWLLWILSLVISLVVILGALSLQSSQNQFDYKKQNDLFQFFMRIPSKGKGNPPVFAYWIRGSNRDSDQIMRLLKAIYHPRNLYLLQLGGASEYEIGELAVLIESERIFRAFENVNVVGKSYAVDEMGSSALAATLHAAALLLKISEHWDWFIPLSSSDYPLINQDDLLHAFTFLPRNLNFIHYDRTRLKEHETESRIVVDPSLYLQKRASIMYAVETREIPDSFSIFGGSPWVILARDFMEYCVKGWDNFPRKLLMYLSNAIYPLESYFHTILCNSPEFRNTTVNNDLSYIDWEPRNINWEPQFLTVSHFEKMLASEAAFARPFRKNDPVLNKIDKEILRRSPNGFVPGEWCSSSSGKILNKSSEVDDHEQFCSSWGNIDIVKAELQGIKLRQLLSKLTSEDRFKSCHCSPTRDEKC
ncbi:hypothetical protein UlMin_041839 [Ulmus minor]